MRIPRIIHKHKFITESISVGFTWDLQRWGLGFHLDLLLYEIELALGPFRLEVEYWDKITSWGSDRVHLQVKRAEERNA